MLKKKENFPKFLVFLGMLQISFLLSCHLLVHKIVLWDGFTLSASTLIFPFTYFFGDVIAEVYGYKISRQLIWASFACMFVFDMLPDLLIHLPSPLFWHAQHAYNKVMDPLPRIFLGDFIAINVGQFVNAYCITKLKILTRGRFFPLRSLFSTIVGETFFTVIAFFIMFSGVNSFHTIMQVMLFSYAFKALCALIAVYPALLFANYLKRKEQIDIYDYNTNFNPFSLEV